MMGWPLMLPSLPRRKRIQSKIINADKPFSFSPFENLPTSCLVTMDLVKEHQRCFHSGSGYSKPFGIRSKFISPLFRGSVSSVFVLLSMRVRGF